MLAELEKQLNPAQLQAVETTEGPVLVIAGAGSGKTRTIVHRLARLVHTGVHPSSILLLTFTRKAATEMLHRAERLLGMGLSGVQGGTFHAFSFATLRRHPQAVGGASTLTIMDRGDAEDVMGQVMGELALGKGDKSFPKKANVLDIYSKSRNKEQSIDEVLGREAFHLLPHAAALAELSSAYQAYKENLGLLDYDDMLFTLERVLVEEPELLEYLRARHRYIMVDEYQDTNRVQARLVSLLAGKAGNVMAVGDDAQSIYAFRGANVENILNFPRVYENTQVIRLEENYRSTQPILNMANAILRQARDKFDKTLYSMRLDGPLPELVKTYSDHSQARLVVEKIRELRRTYMPCEIAVLFRAGYMSYPLELALSKEGIAFQKFGGVRFAEAAHIKDAVAHLRVLHNPADAVAWRRCLTLVEKIGDKTANKIATAVRENDQAYLAAQRKKNAGLDSLLEFLDALRAQPGGPSALLERVVVHYTPALARLHPEDYPRRLTGLEQLCQIAATYANMETFLADLALENPEEERKGVRDDAVVLSTVHSAKGLEWAAVLVIDMVDERFPSRHALARQDDMEEERRLFYVACTRAKDVLCLFMPGNIFVRTSGSTQPAMPSALVRDLPRELVAERRETMSGALTGAIAQDGACHPAPGIFSSASGAGVFGAGASGAGVLAPGASGSGEKPRLGYCRHRIFGRGKVVARIDQDKCRVNFPGFGLKVIVTQYLEMEDP